MIILCILMKLKYVIFSGSYSIDNFGATRSIDVNLTKNIAHLNLPVTIIAYGKINYRGVESVEIGYQPPNNILVRVLRKLGFSTCFQLRKNKLADRWVAQYIRNNSDLIDNETVFIGRASMSENSFRAVKSLGGYTVLHSSWMHPFTQIALLEEEYRRLGRKMRVIPRKRIEVQLNEIQFVNKIWCISDLVYQSYVNNGIAESRLFYLPLGVDFNHYQKDSEQSLNVNTNSAVFTILFVGTVNHEKGAHILFEALKISTLSGIDLILNGHLSKDMSQVFTEYEKCFDEKNINVSIQPGDPTKNYQSSTIFVLPSIHESFGLVVLEAMAAGVPPIVSSTVGAQDCLIVNESGLIFQSQDPISLKENIEYLYSNRAIVEKMSVNSKRQAQKYDWSIICNKMNNIMQTFIK